MYTDRGVILIRSVCPCLFLACSTPYLKYRDRQGYPNQVCLLILIWLAEIVWLDRLTYI